MKLRIPRNELSQALAALKSAAVGTDALPILANVCITANDKSVTLTTSDTHITLRANVAATVEDGGKITVACALLHDIIRSVKSDEVHLELSRKSLRVQCGQSKFTLGTLDAEDFPPVPRVADAAEFDTRENEFRLLLAETSFAAGDDEKRAVFTGVLLQLNGDMKLVSCDGRRLALDSIATSDKKTKASAIIPDKAVAALLRLLSPSPGGEGKGEGGRKVDISVNKNLAQFKFGDYTVITKLIDGEYPDYRKIIPDIAGAGVTIGRNDLLEACRRVALVGDGCKLEFRKQTLTILSRSEKKEVPGEAVETLLIPPTKDVTISIGARYLIEALSALDSDEVVVLAEANRPIMLKSPGKNWLGVIACMKD